MKNFFSLLGHAALGAATTAIATSGAGVAGSWKQIGLIAGSSAATSILSIFLNAAQQVAAQQNQGK